jgi:hypothetical protein
MATGKMRLGFTICGYGYHSGAWRHPDVPAKGRHYRWLEGGR